MTMDCLMVIHSQPMLHSYRPKVGHHVVEQSMITLVELMTEIREAGYTPTLLMKKMGSRESMTPSNYTLQNSPNRYLTQDSKPT